MSNILSKHDVVMLVDHFGALEDLDFDIKTSTGIIDEIWGEPSNVPTKVEIRIASEDEAGDLIVDKDRPLCSDWAPMYKVLVNTDIGHVTTVWVAEEEVARYVPALPLKDQHLLYI